MSVLFETSLGDIVIDLEVDLCPRSSENFLKLCKVYYYNLNAFFNGEFLQKMCHGSLKTYGLSVERLPCSDRGSDRYWHGRGVNLVIYSFPERRQIGTAIFRAGNRTKTQAYT